MKKIIKEIAFQGFNQAEIFQIDSDNTVVCNLHNVTQSGEEVVVNASEQSYGFPAGIDKPFTLTQGEEEYVKGLQPNENWLVDEIKMFLDYNCIDFDQNATKSDLLQLTES